VGYFKYDDDNDEDKKKIVVKNPFSRFSFTVKELKETFDNFKGIVEGLGGVKDVGEALSWSLFRGYEIPSDILATKKQEVVIAYKRGFEDAKKKTFPWLGFVGIVCLFAGYFLGACYSDSGFVIFRKKKKKKKK